MFEDLVVQLHLTLGVEGETADLAFGFTMGGQVAIVFRSHGTEFDDVVAWVEFVGEIAEKITERGLDRRIFGSLDKDDEIGIPMENPQTEMIKGSVKMESGVTGGETGHEDVEIGRIGFTVLLHLVVDFHTFFGDRSDPLNVVGAAVKELPELGRIDEFFDLHLVGLLSEFTPHRIQHQFSQCTFTGVFPDIGMLEDDVFVFTPVSDVFVLKLSCGAMIRIPTGFLFQFEPHVNVLGKEADTRFGKMVHLVNMEQAVPFLEGHLEFGGAPRTCESAFWVGMTAVVDGLLEQGDVNVLADARCTQWEREFLTASVR